MSGKFLGVVAVAALLASTGMANAKGVLMSDAQLDNVTAGASFAFVDADATGVTFTVTAFLSASNTSATSGTATASISTGNITAIGIAPHTASLFAFASAP